MKIPKEKLQRASWLCHDPKMIKNGERNIDPAWSIKPEHNPKIDVNSGRVLTSIFFHLWKKKQYEKGKSYNKNS